MAKETIGVFIFRHEGDGCLTSKYLEHTEDTPYIEACKRITKNTGEDPFEGTYKTTWLESGNSDDIAELNIIRQGDTYEVRWNNLIKNTNLIYTV